MPHRGRKIIWRLAGGEQEIHTRSVFFIGGKMWKVYKYNGRFIQGDLISKHSSEAAAVKAAKKAIGFKKKKREKSKEEIVIWLDGDDGDPMGIIVKKQKKGDEKVSTG